MIIISALLALPALAADPFTVAGVPVDATGANAIEAQTTAISEGQALAARVLVERMTLDRERNSKGLGDLNPETIQRMIRALEIANEKRSGSRYLGDITVAFNPSQVQQFLQSQGLTMISTQARTRLVLPVMGNDPLWSDNEWSQVWQTGAHTYALTPARGIKPGEGTAAIISAAGARAADIAALRRAGQRYGLEQILIAEAMQSGGGVRVKLTDVALDTGTKRNLGVVSASSFDRAAMAVIAKLEDDWKQASVSLADNAVSMPVSVLYGSHMEWQRLQTAINGSAQIQGARLDALSKDGALMTITYGGDMKRLRDELAFKGVDVRSDPKLGVIMSRSGRF